MKLNRPQVLILVTIFILAGIAAGFCEGTQESDTADVTGVSGVVLGAPGTLYLNQGDTPAFRMEGNSRALSRIRTSVQDNTLRIRTIGAFTFIDSLDYYLTLPEIKEISTSSSGSILTDEISCSYIRVRSSSSGNISIGRINADGLDIRITSSGDIELRGTAETLDAVLSSSGSLQAEDLEVREADIRISSSGDARVWIRETLSARLTSSGSLILYGEPEIIDHRTTSSGGITARGKK